jgi:hypothetical protein
MKENKEITNHLPIMQRLSTIISTSPPLQPNASVPPQQIPGT